MEYNCINEQWYFIFIYFLVVFGDVVLSLVFLYVVFVSLPHFPFGTNKVLNHQVCSAFRLRPSCLTFDLHVDVVADASHVVVGQTHVLAGVLL